MDTGPEALSREELIEKARQLGVNRPELLTRVELRDEIVRATETDERRRRQARGWLGVARDLLASVVEQGLHLPDAAALIRGDISVTDPIRPQRPVATVTLAEIYAAQGHVKRAIGILDEVLAKEPDHDAAQWLRNRLQAQLSAAADTAAQALLATDQQADQGGFSAGAAQVSESPEPESLNPAAEATATEQAFSSEPLAARITHSIEDQSVAARSDHPPAEAVQPSAAQLDLIARSQPAPTGSEPFAPNEPAPYEPEPFAPTETAPSEPEPFAPTETAPSESEPFVPNEPAPSEPKPFVPTETAPSESEPFAPTETERIVQHTDLTRPEQLETLELEPIASQHTVGFAAPVLAESTSQDRPEPVSVDASTQPAASTSTTVEPADASQAAIAPVTRAIDCLFVIADGGRWRCYWELREARLERLRVSFPGGRLTMRVVRTTPSWDGARIDQQEVEVHGASGSVELAPAHPGGALRAAVGWETNGTFRPLAVGSEVVLDPDERPMLRFSAPSASATAAYTSAALDRAVSAYRAPV